LRFDQGPLEDVPSFIPEGDDDDEDEAAPPPVVKPASNTRVAALSLPEEPVAPRSRSRSPQPEKKLAPPRVETDNQSEKSIEPPLLSQSDRWAQIRKNAAERAQRMNEEQKHGRNPSQGRSDDGETSGEETIESRVARIKARVAELTGL
jgi:hypothetical protein